MKVYCWNFWVSSANKFPCIVVLNITASIHVLGLMRMALYYRAVDHHMTTRSSTVLWRYFLLVGQNTSVISNLMEHATIFGFHIKSEAYRGAVGHSWQHNPRTFKPHSWDCLILPPKCPEMPTKLPNLSKLYLSMAGPIPFSKVLSFQ